MYFCVILLGRARVATYSRQVKQINHLFLQNISAKLYNILWDLCYLSALPFKKWMFRQKINLGKYKTYRY